MVQMSCCFVETTPLFAFCLFWHSFCPCRFLLIVLFIAMHWLRFSLVKNYNEVEMFNAQLTVRVAVKSPLTELPVISHDSYKCGVQLNWLISSSVIIFSLLLEMQQHIDILCIDVSIQGQPMSIYHVSWYIDIV